MRVHHVRAAELDALDWDELRGAPVQICIGDADARLDSVYVDWNWLEPNEEQASTDPRREPAVAV